MRKTRLVTFLGLLILVIMQTSTLDAMFHHSRLSNRSRLYNCSRSLCSFFQMCTGPIVGHLHSFLGTCFGKPVSGEHGPTRSFLDLPNEVIIYVFDFLPQKKLIELRLVNRQIEDLIDKNWRQVGHPVLVITVNPAFCECEIIEEEDEGEFEGGAQDIDGRKYRGKFVTWAQGISQLFGEDRAIGFDFRLFIERFTNVQLIVLSHNLKNHKIRSLNLGDTGVLDLTPLKELTEIQVLNLEFTGVTDLTPLKELTEIQVLNLMRTGVSDLAPLAESTKLQIIDLMRTGVSDLAPLAESTKLQVLNLGGTEISGLTPLKVLKELRVLNLSSCIQVADLTPLKEFILLEELYLWKTQASDLSPLEGLTALKYLELTNKPVEDTSCIDHLVKRGLKIIRR